MLNKEFCKKVLDTALSKGGDFADLFYKDSYGPSLNLSEDKIKIPAYSIRTGIGIRVIKGEETGYAYTNAMTEKEIQKIVAIASTIPQSGKGKMAANLEKRKFRKNRENGDKIRKISVSN